MINKEDYSYKGFSIELKWFENPEVRKFNTSELRLLIIYSGRVVEELTGKEKEWIFARNKNVNCLNSMKEKLRELGLIEHFENEFNDNMYTKVNFGRYQYVRFEDICAIKNIRQLFIACAKNNSRELIVSQSLIDSLFNYNSRGTQYWKRTCQQMNVEVQKIQSPNNGGIRLVVPSKNNDRYKKKNTVSDNGIGRTFEMYYGDILKQKGYSVSYRGIDLGIKDGGIDLIAFKDDSMELIQCKYWSRTTYITDNVISQTYGSAINILTQENLLTKEEINDYMSCGKIKIKVVTHTKLAPSAKTVANALGVEYVENICM